MRKIKREEFKSAWNSESEDEGLVPYMFASALDVGSTFVDVLPEEDIKFRYRRDHSSLHGMLYLQNVTPKATVAFYVWTAEKGFCIEPEYRFIPPGGYVYV